MSESGLHFGRFQRERSQRQLLLAGAPVGSARAFDVLAAFVERRAQSWREGAAPDEDECVALGFLAAGDGPVISPRDDPNEPAGSTTA